MARPKRTAQQMRRAQPPVIEPNAVYQRKELPHVMRLGRDVVTQALKSGELRHVRKGNRFLVRGEWIIAYLEKGDTPRPPLPDSDVPGEGCNSQA